MADDNEQTDINLDDNTVTSGSSSKKGGLGNLFPMILKWLIIVIVAIIFVVTVVVIVVKVMGGNVSTATTTAITDERESPDREILDWYKSIGVIRTQTSDPNPASVMVEVYLGYKKDDKATATEITARNVEIIDFLRRYFSQKTADELRPQNEDNLKIEIRNAINDDILSNSKIVKVIFYTKEVIEP